MVTSDHTCKTVSDKVWFGVVVGVSEDVCDCHRVCGHETAATNETSVYKIWTIARDPICDEVVVFLVMHFLEISCEQRRRWRAGKMAQRGSELSENEEKEGMEETCDHSNKSGGEEKGRHT